MLCTSTYFSTEIIKIKVTSNHQPLNKYKDQNSTELRIPLWPFEDKFFCFYSEQLQSFIYHQNQEIHQETLRLHPERKTNGWRKS